METRQVMSGSRRILVAIDDPELCRSLVEQLWAEEEFAPVEALSGAEAVRLTGRHYFDAIILDAGLPDINGQELCRRFREAGIRSPILILTAADSEADMIQCLEAGANAYITKPFRVSVLFAHIRAQLRQHEQSDSAVFAIGPYSFQPSAKLLVDSTARKKVRLTEKETAILKFLYRAGDRTTGRDTLLGEIWGYNAGVTTHTLETHIYRLRRKIEREPARAQILVTEPGGYRLVP